MHLDKVQRRSGCGLTPSVGGLDIYRGLTICSIPMTQDEYYDLQPGDRFTWMGGEPYPFPVYEVLAGEYVVGLGGRRVNGSKKRLLLFNLSDCTWMEKPPLSDRTLEGRPTSLG